MNYLYYSIFTLFILLLNTPLISAQNINTVEFDAEINDTQIVNAELSSYLDNLNTTHIAWFKHTEDTRTLVYTTVSSEGSVSSTELKSYPNGRPIAPQITVDGNGGIHIVYIMKRDIDAGTKTGNYAIMYAGDGNGDGVFEHSQISTNPTDPDDNTESEFDAYVNGRPTITISEVGVVTVFFSTDSNSDNGYDNQLAKAELNGGSWDLSIQFNADDFVEGTFDIDEDFVAPTHEGNTRYLATIDISDYRPQFFRDESGSWSKTVLEEYSGIFNNSDIRLETDNEGDTYLMWMHETDDDDRFVYTKLDGDSYSDPVSVILEQNPAGNLFGYAIDKTTKEVHYFYNRSFNSNSYLITMDENGNSFETEIPDLGVVYGKRSLHANNGFISLVTGSESDQKIYITTGYPNEEGTSAEQEAAKPNQFSLNQNYPNPFNPSTVISYQIPKSSDVTLKVFDMLGREVAELVNGRKAAGNYETSFDASNLTSGMYIYRIKAGDFMETRKMMLIK
ncbi:MAG: T9SS type A sorting domain-containing protein [Gracilimonas sp.]